MRCASLLFVSLAACGPQDADFETLATASSLSVSDTAVRLHFVPSSRDECDHLSSSLVTTVNGAVISSGAVGVTREAQGTCVASWSFPDRPVGRLQVKVSEGKTSLSAEVSNVFDPRTLSTGTIAANTLRAGQGATFSWAPADDVFVSAQALVYEALTHALVRTATATGGKGQVQLTMPTDFIGSAEVAVRATVRPAVISCDAPMGCFTESLPLVESNRVAVSVWP